LSDSLAVPILLFRAFEEAATSGQVPPRALTRVAMAHLAIYHVVNAIEGARFEAYASIASVHAA
jgi:hypothetical protein